MPVRRLQISYSSDEDEEDQSFLNPRNQLPVRGAQVSQDSTVTHRHVTQSSSIQNPNGPNRIVNLPEPIDLSDGDEEFIDASETMPPPSSASDYLFQQPQVAPMSGVESTGCPVGDYLSNLGLRLKKEWLDSCIEELSRSVPGFLSLHIVEKAKHCFKMFMISDMNDSGGGVLPQNVNSIHLVQLPGPFVLQVDEIVNITSSLRGRYEEKHASLKRCLKLSLTDGVQRVFGMEYRPIKNLQVLAPAGLKVIIRNVHIRHGLLMLVPEALEVLGGVAEALDLARERLVKEVNKPPRGKRTRTGVVPPLATRSTMSAWSSDGVSIHEQSHAPDSAFMGDPVVPPLATRSTIPAWSSDGVSIHEQSHAPDNAFMGNPVVSPLATRSTMDAWASDGVSSHWQSRVPDNSGAQNHTTRPHNTTMLREENQGSTSAAPGTRTDQQRPDEFTVQTKRKSASPNLSVIHIDNEEDAISYQNQGPFLNPDDMIDEFEHPLFLSGDRQVPFMYLASLSAMSAAIEDTSVRGNVKCFLTGVKGFQFKQRTTYELRVYIDDGSLISEILIDHNVVQRGIRHSPVEVTAALSSSDKKIASHMRETLRQFQTFLENFEGTMLVEKKKDSLPNALDMNQGVLDSDLLLLLRRVRSLSGSQALPHPPVLDPIEISP